MGSESSPSATGRSGAVLIYALTLLVAACSLLFELLLAQTLSALLGNTVLRYSITFANVKAARSGRSPDTPG